MSYDTYGNVRLADLELARRLKDRVSASLAARGIEIGIAAKDLGYELRCAPPGGYDIQYARSLGYAATRFLLDGGTEAMVTIQAGRLVPVPFRDLLDPGTGRVRLRYADVSSEAYRTLYAYMIRLKREDFGRPDAGRGPGDGERAGREGVRRPLRLSDRRRASAPRTRLRAARLQRAAEPRNRALTPGHSSRLRWWAECGVVPCLASRLGPGSRERPGSRTG